MQRSKNEICILCGKTHNSGRNIIEYFQCTVCKKLQQLPHDVCGFGGVDGIECTCGRKADAVWKQISFEEYKKLTSAVSEMTNEEILENAPDKNLRHYDGNYYWQYTNDNGWCRYCNPIAKTVVGEPSSGMRSLSDIRRIVELEQKLEAAEQALKSAEDRVDAYKLHVDEMRETQFRRFNNEECWIYQGDGEDYPESLICPVVISAEQLRTFLAAERERDDMKANIDHLMKDCHRFTDKRLNEFAIEQKIFELERFMQTFIKAAMDAPVPEINWQANELMRKALIGALETAKNERIVELKEQLV